MDRHRGTPDRESSDYARILGRRISAHPRRDGERADSVRWQRRLEPVAGTDRVMGIEPTRAVWAKRKEWPLPPALRNYAVTPTRAPAGIRDARHPATTRRAPPRRSPIRRRVSGVADGTTRSARSTNNRRTIRASAITPRSCHGSVKVPQRGRFVPDPIFAEHRRHSAITATTIACIERSRV